MVRPFRAYLAVAYDKLTVVIYPSKLIAHLFYLCVVKILSY